MTQHTEREIENDGLRARFYSWLNQTTPNTKRIVDFQDDPNGYNVYSGKSKIIIKNKAILRSEATTGLSIVLVVIVLSG